MHLLGTSTGTESGQKTSNGKEGEPEQPIHNGKKLPPPTTTTRGSCGGGRGSRFRLLAHFGRQSPPATIQSGGLLRETRPELEKLPLTAQVVNASETLSSASLMHLTHNKTFSYNADALVNQRV